MPSMLISYCPPSGFVALISGNMYSGYRVPNGGIQLIASASNSGNLYISLSGGNPFPASGIYSTPPSSGGATINSGSYSLSGTSSMDALPLTPGSAMFLPHYAIQTGGVLSGVYSVSIGQDPGCSGGFGRIYWDCF